MRTPGRVVVLGLVAALAGTVAVQQQAEAATGTTLYVDSTSTACTDSGVGSQAAPFCSIQAAANAATAGDTVLISAADPIDYNQTVTIANSGTATAPITFTATGGPVFNAEFTWTISSSYVVVSDGELGDNGPLTVSGSHVTLESDQIYGNQNAGVVIAASASDTTIERSFLANGESNSAVEVNGASGTVLTTNVVSTNPITTGTPMIAVSKASNTTITSNSLETNCATALSVTGSAGTSIENNVVSVNCFDSGQSDLVVDGTSATSTTEGYNLLDAGTSGPNAYLWAGNEYPTQAAFAAATGQGADDLLSTSVDSTTDSIANNSAASADANPSAPGELPSDLYGATWPSSTPDRGAIALKEFTDATLYSSTNAQAVGVTLDLNGVAWGATPNLTVNWGDGTTPDTGPVSDVPQAGIQGQFGGSHSYAQRGTYTVTVTLTDDAQTITRTTTVSPDGDSYVPIAPTRVLDTRKGIGAAKAKVGPNGTVPVNVTNGVTLPTGLGTISAVVMNVTVADSTSGGNITAYPGGTALPTTSNLNFTTGETVPNLVTVKVGSGNTVDLRNSSIGGSDLIADVEGYYVDSDSGTYYLPNTPERILDTRKGIGAAEAPVATNGIVTLNVPQCVSGSGSSAVKAAAVAVAVNVTVVSPTSSGYITAYPDQTTAPIASNVNFGTGETVANLVVVKVGSDGKVELHNSSPGTVQLVADLEGCYSSTLGDAFVPVTPYRTLDSRTGLGQEVAGGGAPANAHQNVIWWPQEDRPPGDEDGADTAAVMNVTVTQPQAGGDIRAYPYDASLPTASNLNFTAGETVPNLVMVATSRAFNMSLYNDSVGKSDLIADVFGYFA